MLAVFESRYTVPDQLNRVCNRTPDGMRVDSRGNVYVTGPGGIWAWDPDGTRLGVILLPETAANLAWGDADFHTLYITATTSVYRLRAKATGFVPPLHRLRAAARPPAVIT